MIYRYIHRNPSKIFFLERTGFPADNIFSRVAWKFRGGMKVQKGLEVQDCQFTTNFAGCQFDHLKLSANSI